MKNCILFPFDNNLINDKELRKEYDIVRWLNLFNVLLFDYKLWNEKKILKLSEPLLSRPLQNLFCKKATNSGSNLAHNLNNGVIRDDLSNDNIEAIDKLIYRGYMMKTEDYQVLYNSLIDNHLNPITTPIEYSNMHIFYNIYNLIKEDTARTLFFHFDDIIDICYIRKNFDRFIIKDYVKSVKNKFFPKYLNSYISQKELDEYIIKFKELRGKLLTAGICIKEYLNFKLYDGKINEFRVFYMNGNILTISRNSLQAEFTNTPPTELINKYKNLPSHFYTIDYVELFDGRFKIMEVGDGQVSGLSFNQNYETFFREMYNCVV